jgi:myo-inositol 2-dehydrogenase/D-chiro-inositol 1-dehydrogenase
MSENMIGRRQFLTGAAGAGLLILKPELVRGTQANSAVRVGLLGCGGRGTGVATGMVKDAGARLVAVADLFDDSAKKAKALFDALAPIDASQVFTGPEAAEKIAASKEVDAVYIATPPYFHVQHLATVVNAGKHVYVEKPVAIDVPGAKRVIELGRQVGDKKTLAVGFQIRKAPPYVELVKRIHAGALGDIVTGDAHYWAGFIDRPEWPGASPTTLRLRNWIWDRLISGDIIVEQNIHVIDVCNWALKGHPISAVGTGGRKGRARHESTYSHFNVGFTYPNDVHLTFSSTQFNQKGYFDANERLFGTKASSTSPYAGPLGIIGEEPWTWAASEQPAAAQFSATGSFGDNLGQADPEKQRAFISSIANGKPVNEAEQGAESALSAMLGRTAAYTGRKVTWDELLRSTEQWDPGIDIRKL